MHLTDLEIDLLSVVVFSEGFADHLGKGLKRQGAEDRVFPSVRYLAKQRKACAPATPRCHHPNIRIYNNPQKDLRQHFDPPPV